MSAGLIRWTIDTLFEASFCEWATKSSISPLYLLGSEP
jgi:hypothetical protein